MTTDWTFKNKEIAATFDAHVREQLPWYDMATGAAAHIARHYIPRHGLVYDIGASTGNIGKAIEQTLKQRQAKLIAIDESSDMAGIYQGPGDFVIADALDYEFQKFDVAFVFLVLMFLPVWKRKDFMERLISKLNVGGAIIVFDKLEAETGYIGTILHRLTIAGKVANGAEPAKVIEKELSLCGIQRPLPHFFMRNLTPQPVEIFRFGEFAGWVIEKAA